MFNEQNTVEDYVKDLLVKQGWKFIPKEKLPRKETDVLVESHVLDALVKLNPSIQEDKDRAEEILYKLQMIISSARGTGLVKANEELSKWLRNEKTMPFGENSEHVSINLIDYDNPEKNNFVITTQYTYVSGQNRRPDLVLLVNGFPLVIGEAKTPVRPAISWVDGAIQLEEYQESLPQLFVPNIFCFATEGKTYRFAPVKAPINEKWWQPWRKTTDTAFESLEELRNSIKLMLKPEKILEILKNYVLYSTARGGQSIKILCRYQQYEAAKQILKRVIDGKIKKGLIWHFQGSGKSLLMVYAAQLLRQESKLKSPTVMVVVDRIDLNSQISGTFNTSQIPNTVVVDSRAELRKLLEQDTRKIIITTIHKFAEAEGVLNERENIVVLVDEAHRTQEGDLGKKMRESLPNAFLFGLTGTPINKRDRNTFWAFGAKEDKDRYMNRYSFEQSLKDKATLPIYFEPRPVELRINKKVIDETFDTMTDKLSDNDKAELSRQTAKFGVLIKTPARIRDVCANIVKHYKEYVEPNGFKGQVVVFDRKSCDLYKRELDKIMSPEESAVVMTVNAKEVEWRKKYYLTDDELEKLLERFRDPADPLKLLIVTSKLLTGFDAEINQVMYLDKPMKDHTLLQAICRVNRPCPNKNHGLIVDYLGIFDNVRKNLNFDIKEVQKAISNLEELKKEIPKAIKKCLSHFKNIDKSIGGYEGLLAAQDCLITKKKRDHFGADYSYLTRHWEAISPDNFLDQFEKDYIWLTQVYQSLQPVSGSGKLIWHALGAKTIKLVNENVTVQTIRDDLDTLIMDAKIFEKISKKDAKSKAKEIEMKIVWRLHKHVNDPKFKEIGKRLEEIKDKHYKNILNSLEFLKEMLDLAKDVVILERETEVELVDNSKEALTKIFLECKIEKTPKIIENIVKDIDSMVKKTRFDGWQWTQAGEREIKQALRRTLLKYKLHKEQDLFDKSYDYLREHY